MTPVSGDTRLDKWWAPASERDLDAIGGGDRLVFPPYAADDLHADRQPLLRTACRYDNAGLSAERVRQRVAEHTLEILAVQRRRPGRGGAEDELKRLHEREHVGTEPVPVRKQPDRFAPFKVVPAPVALRDVERVAANVRGASLDCVRAGFTKCAGCV